MSTLFCALGLFQGPDEILLPDFLNTHIKYAALRKVGKEWNFLIHL